VWGLKGGILFVCPDFPSTNWRGHQPGGPTSGDPRQQPGWCCRCMMLLIHREPDDPDRGIQPGAISAAPPGPAATRQDPGGGVRRFHTVALTEMMQAGGPDHLRGPGRVCGQRRRPAQRGSGRADLCARGGVVRLGDHRLPTGNWRHADLGVRSPRRSLHVCGGHIGNDQRAYLWRDTSDN